MKTVTLTHGAVAWVDDADYADLAQFNWTLTSQGYAARGGKGGFELMHRRILGLSRGDSKRGHHCNENRLDNRRTNLQAMTAGAHQRHHLATGYAYFNRRVGRWYAAARVRGKTHSLGGYTTQAEALAIAAAFQEAAGLDDAAEIAGLPETPER